MTDVPTFERISTDILDQLAEIGSATIAGALSKKIRNPHMAGLTTFAPGRSIAGHAVTLQFMPKREDIHWSDEYSRAPESELHRTALQACSPGDIVVVDARANMTSGVFGDMMLTSFAAQGGQGVVIDGCIRDYPNVQKIDVGLWLRGVTPNYHVQTDIFPHAVNIPIACAGVFVVPGDIIVADDDGAVVLPKAMAADIAESASQKAEWEVFSKMKLQEGGSLSKYYPLTDEARVEYEAWLKEQGK